jgi:ribosomal protein L1
MELKSLGIHTTKSGKRYHLQFDPEGKLAQAVLLPHGQGEEHLVLAFRAESREEAAKMLIEELGKGSH